MGYVTLFPLEKSTRSFSLIHHREYVMKRVSFLLFILYAGNLVAQVVFDTLEGQHIPLSNLANKKIIINYWAEWCQPCVEEIQSLNQFYKTHSQSVALFAVNFDQPALSTQRKAVKAYHINYPSLASDPAQALKLGEITAVPTTFILNTQGKVMKALYGPQTVKSLAKALDL